MKSDDSQANNLFSRLLSYTPQDGGLTPLENFCTEGLAWCLRNSPEFRKRFLNLVSDKLLKPEKQALFLHDLDKSPIEIHTQFSFKDDDESKRGFFDLVIQANDFVLVIEVKFYSDFGETQIPDYRQEVDTGQSFPECKGKFLASLTRWRVFPVKVIQDLDATVFWPQVLEALREAASGNEKLQLKGDNSSAVSFMLVQFADFLKKKHVTPMKIATINPEVLMNWTSYFSFYAASIEILERFRDEQKDAWKPKQIDNGFNYDKAFFYWGTYSRTHINDWCGFVFFNEKQPPELVMQVEGQFRKGIKMNQITSYLGNVLRDAVQQGFHDEDNCQDSTWLHFHQPINIKFNGNAEAMYEWLASASKEFSELREKLGA